MFIVDAPHWEMGVFFLSECKQTDVACLLLQHNSILGSVFADFYDQQLPSIQASALSQQVQCVFSSQLSLALERFTCFLTTATFILVVIASWSSST